MSEEKRIGGVKPPVFWGLVGGFAVFIVLVLIVGAIGGSGESTKKKKSAAIYNVPALWVKACEKEAATYGTGALSTKAKRIRACEKWSEMFPAVGLKGDKSRKKSDAEWADGAGTDGGTCLAVKLIPETVQLDEGPEDYAFYADYCDTFFASAREVFPKQYRQLFGS